MAKPIRVLLAEDDHLVRAGLRSLFADEPDLEVVGEASNGVEAIARTEALRPDVILLDLFMPGLSGLDAIAAIRQHNPAARILVLSGYDDGDLIFAAIQAGATGYLLKTAALPDLVRAIRTVYAGETSLQPSIATKLVHRLTHSLPPVKPISVTERERLILQLVARGLSNAEIAQSLQINLTTVRTHLNRILRKLHLASRTQAALYALRTGLATLHDDGC
jgi:NarL family two-component system response regulator LiaR